jgi:hypothetical protein
MANAATNPKECESAAVSPPATNEGSILGFNAVSPGPARDITHRRQIANVRKCVVS